MAITQAQIDALIQFIDETETAESVTNVIVAAIVRFLNDKIKHVEETQLTIEDLEEEAGERINADTTIQQNVDTLSNRINALLNNLSNKTDKNSTTGRLEFSQAAPVVLKSMGQEVDGKSVSIGVDDIYYDDSLKKIRKKISSMQSISIGDPDQSIIYGNAANDKTYRWNGTKWVTVSGGDLGGEIQAIKNNMQTLLDALSNIAFNGERPEFDWSDSGGGGGDSSTKFKVTQNLTNLESSYNQTYITIGDRLTVILSIKSSLANTNLYVIDDDSVVVMMDNIDITEDSYDPETGTIDIQGVTGKVVITASAITYVDGCIFMLDCKNKGSVENQWQNLADANNPLIINTGHSVGPDDGITFSTPGTSVQNEADFVMISGKTYADYTTEAVFKQTTAISSSVSGIQQSLIVTGAVRGPIIAEGYYNAAIFYNACTDALTTFTDGKDGVIGNSYQSNMIAQVCHYGLNFAVNGKNLAQGQCHNLGTIRNEQSAMYGKLAISGFVKRQSADGLTPGTYDFPWLGSIYAVRIYSRILSEQERAQNFKVDKKRFNIN